MLTDKCSLHVVVARLKQKPLPPEKDVLHPATHEA